MIHTTFNTILEGALHAESEAIAWANGIVFCELETTTQEIRHGDHIATVQGDVGIWYDYVGDYYFFTDGVIL